VTVSQLLLLVAVHAQPVGAVTVIAPEPPADPSEMVAGANAYEQGTDAVNWKTLETVLGVLPPGPTAATRDS
jgi:hypothetical protein